MREATIEQVNNGYIVSKSYFNADAEYITERTVFEEEYELINYVAKQFDWDTIGLLKEIEEMWS